MNLEDTRDILASMQVEDGKVAAALMAAVELIDDVIAMGGLSHPSDTDRAA